MNKEEEKEFWTHITIIKAKDVLKLKKELQYKIKLIEKLEQNSFFKEELNKDQ